ncbi:MAG TPA: DNA replication/repair protein RecF [Tissierellaceae bacterium]|nr:DNA replication/repair protein RecF [Tissierellaceae bacterium]
MYYLNLKDIRLINFRNYYNIDLELNEKINIFIGKNAQGKTNLIEAIYMCASGKSFRTNRDKEIINFNKKQAYIGTNIDFGNNQKFLEIKMEENKQKRIRINKTELKNYRELKGGLNVVVFTPEDLRIIKDGPQKRRRFLDTGISQVRPVYNYNISRYRKLLSQRNNILRTAKFKQDNDINNLLEVFDIQISKIGTSIMKARYDYIEELSKFAKKTHNNITEKEENLSLKYISNVPISEDKESMEKEYLNLTKQNIRRDLEYGTTEIGPHRDDIFMSINNKDVKIFGSQGQQRTVMLSLILSEVELIKIERGMYPVLLLDDVFSELDINRRKYLSKLFYNMQTFITLTNSENIKSMDEFNKSIFYIEDGQVKSKE